MGILDEQRSLCEDLERLEQACADRSLEEPRTVRCLLPRGERIGLKPAEEGELTVDLDTGAPATRPPNRQVRRPVPAAEQSAAGHPSGRRRRPTKGNRLPVGQRPLRRILPTALLHQRFPPALPQ